MIWISSLNAWYDKVNILKKFKKKIDSIEESKLITRIEKREKETDRSIKVGKENQSEMQQ